MDDDDDVHSLSAATGSPEPNGGRITVTLPSGHLSTPTTTAHPPAAQGGNNNQASKTNGGGGGGGGGREDCWSEGATGVLIDAWGERYLELSRGNLKQKHWKEVADVVSSREDYSKSAKTDIQCKNRIDTVKKKYKLEKAKIAAGGGPSHWPCFHQLDELIGPTAKIPTSIPSNAKVPVGIPVGIRGGSGSAPLKRHRFVPVKLSGNNQATKNHQNWRMQFRRREAESSSEEEEEEEADSDDSFPPEKRRRVVKREVNVGNAKGGKERKGWWGNSVRMLTQAILKFGEAYEQAESAKLQQVVEMEKARMKFAKELELQRMQFFMKTQMEISQLKHGRSGGGNAPTSKHPGGNNNIHNNNNNSNNSDSDNCD